MCVRVTVRAGVRSRDKFNPDAGKIYICLKGEVYGGGGSGEEECAQERDMCRKGEIEKNKFLGSGGDGGGGHVFPLFEFSLFFSGGYIQVILKIHYWSLFYVGFL